MRYVVCKYGKMGDTVSAVGNFIKRLSGKICISVISALLITIAATTEARAAKGNELLQEVFFQSVDSSRVSMLKIDMAKARKWMDLALMSICDSDTYYTYKLLNVNMSLMKDLNPAHISTATEAGNYFLDRTDTVARYAMGCYWYTMANLDLYMDSKNAEMYYNQAEEIFREGGFNDFADQCLLFKTEALIRNYKYVEAASLSRKLLKGEYGSVTREMRYFSLLQLYKIYTHMRIMPMVEYYGRIIEREGFYAESLIYETRYLQRKICYLLYIRDIEEAMPLCKRLTQIADLLKTEGGEWTANLLFARLLIMDKQYDEALKYVKVCDEIYNDVSNVLFDPYFAKEHMSLARAICFARSGIYASALEVLSKIDTNSVMFDFYEFSSGYHSCYELCYQLKGDYANAIKSMERRKHVCDSIVNNHTLQRTIDLEGAYLNDATILNHKAQLMEQEVALSLLRKRIIIGILIVAVLVIGYYVFRIGYKRKEKVRKAQMTKDMNDFLEKEVARQTEELIMQSAQIRNRNNDIMLSQLYAQRIQQGILPPLDKIKIEGIENSFVIFKPIETVSGDFYWFDRVGDKIVVCCADSSGHGVPGAMMSMVGMTLVTEVVRRKRDCNSAELMNTINDELLRMMPDLSWLDGINMSLVVIDPTKKVLNITLSRHNTVYFSQGELDYIRGTKRRVGDRLKPVCDRKFQMYSIEYEKGDSLYLYTDGITELFGGKNTEKLKISGFKKILQKADSAPSEEREQIIKDGIDEWRGELGLNDDILIIGLQF